MESETVLRSRCQELYLQGQQAQAAAYHWHSKFLEMEKQVEQVKREGEQKLSKMSEANQQLQQRVAEVSTEARNSANAHRVMAEAESKRTAELTEERVRRQEADRRLDDCVRVIVALSIGPLEDHLASLIRVCQNDALAAARDADLLRRTRQKLDKLLHSISMQATFLNSLLPERHKSTVELRVRDLRKRLNAVLTGIPEHPVKPPICGICMAPVTNFAECDHEFHETCARQWLSRAIPDRKSYPLKCYGTIDPVDGDTSITCDRLVTSEWVELMFCRDKDVDKQTFNKWQISVLDEDENGEIVECPECKNILIGEIGNLNRVRCGYCRRAFCVKCNVAWHAEKTCEEFQAWQDEKSPAYQQFLAYARSNKIVQCKCKQKWKGCNHLKCPYCHNEWCHLCEKQFSAGEYDTHYSTPNTSCYAKLFTGTESDVKF